jgi:mitosis inhibitor protein kinase SWE1
MLPPDPSRLFISGHVEGKSFEEKKATAVPVTPTTGLRARRLVTPVNVHGAGRLDLDEYLCKRFARVDPVGKGEFSTVYRVAYPKHSTALARNDSYESPRLAVPGSPAPGTAFAVKKSRHPYHGARDRDLKLKEVRILSSLTAAHHVLRFISSWELNGHLYIQTEYCDEGTLDKFLGNIGRQGRLDDFRIWKILHDLSLVSANHRFTEPFSLTCLFRA